VDDSMGECTIDRTIAIDPTVELIRSQRNLLPAVLPEDYVSQLTANVRRVQRDEEKATVKVRWVPTRPDDYAFAEVYDVIATHLYLRRVAIDEVLASEVAVPLDELIPFRRSRLDEYSDFDVTDYAQPRSDVNAHGFYFDRWEEAL
jgi:hypothetical protein